MTRYNASPVMHTEPTLPILPAIDISLTSDNQKKKERHLTAQAPVQIYTYKEAKWERIGGGMAVIYVQGEQEIIPQVGITVMNRTFTSPLFTFTTTPYDLAASYDSSSEPRVHTFRAGESKLALAFKLTQNALEFKQAVDIIRDASDTLIEKGSKVAGDRESKRTGLRVDTNVARIKQPCDPLDSKRPELLSQPSRPLPQTPVQQRRASSVDREAYPPTPHSGGMKRMVANVFAPAHKSMHDQSESITLLDKLLANLKPSRTHISKDSISQPADFEHVSHISLNAIRNVPQCYKTLFKEAGISTADLKSPSCRAVIASVLNKAGVVAPFDPVPPTIGFRRPKERSSILDPPPLPPKNDLVTETLRQLRSSRKPSIPDTVLFQDLPPSPNITPSGSTACSRQQSVQGPTESPAARNKEKPTRLPSRISQVEPPSFSVPPPPPPPPPPPISNTICPAVNLKIADKKLKPFVKTNTSSNGSDYLDSIRNLNISTYLKPTQLRVLTNSSSRHEGESNSSNLGCSQLVAQLANALKTHRDHMREEAIDDHESDDSAQWE